jgi:hypothetical protein
MPKPMPSRNDRCEHWGASLKSDQTFFWEMAADVACADLLLAEFAMAGYAIYQWEEG